MPSFRPLPISTMRLIIHIYHEACLLPPFEELGDSPPSSGSKDLQPSFGTSPVWQHPAPHPTQLAIPNGKSLSYHIRNCFLGNMYQETKRRWRTWAESAVPNNAPRTAVKSYSAFVQSEISWQVWVAPAAASLAVSARDSCRAQPGTWAPCRGQHALTSQPLVAAQPLNYRLPLPPPPAPASSPPFPPLLQPPDASCWPPSQLVAQAGLCRLCVFAGPGHDLLVLALFPHFLTHSRFLPFAHPCPWPWIALGGLQVCLNCPWLNYEKWAWSHLFLPQAHIKCST